MTATPRQYLEYCRSFRPACAARQNLASAGNRQQETFSLRQPLLKVSESQDQPSSCRTWLVPQLAAAAVEVCQCKLQCLQRYPEQHLAVSLFKPVQKVFESDGLNSEICDVLVLAEG